MQDKIEPREHYIRGYRRGRKNMLYEALALIEKYKKHYPTLVAMLDRLEDEMMRNDKEAGL